MSNKNEINSIELQLFADGGSDGGTGAVGGNTADNGGFATTAKTSSKNALADVQYGIQDENAPTDGVQNETADDAGVDLDSEFEELIKGKYKEQYNKRTQDTIKSRLKGTKETVDKYNQLTPILDALSVKYGVDANDIEALNRAIEEDDSYWEEEALEKGMTVDQLKGIRKVEKENAELKQKMQEEYRDKLFRSWIEQSEQLKAVYPSFDLDAEMENPKFKELIALPGVDVRTAYELVHKDDIIRGAMQFTAQQVQQKTVNSIRTSGSRPAENGISSASSAVVKNDVSQLTKADRREIARRVARGDKIRF